MLQLVRRSRTTTSAINKCKVKWVNITFSHLLQLSALFFLKSFVKRRSPSTNNSQSSIVMDHSCFDRLPDDGLVTIGSWVAATGLDNFARCLKVCRRFRHVLGRPSLLKELIRERTGAHEIETLEHLALWDAIDQVGLWEENRVGFGFGSLTVESDYIPPDLHQFQRRRERDIPYSEKRIADVTRILTRFPSTFLRIEAHCGTAAPPVMAEQFSAARDRKSVV